MSRRAGKYRKVLWLLAFVFGSAASISASSAAERFVVNGKTVLDTKTGLTWMRCSAGQHWIDSRGCTGSIAGFTWDAARAIRTGGFRLPTDLELASIIDEDRKQRHLVPKVDRVAFPGLEEGQLLWYWTSSPVGSCIDDRREGCGYYVDLGNSGADVVFPLPRYKLLSVLLVSAETTSPRADSSQATSSVSGFFVLTGDEAKDTRTGFVWQRCSVGETYSADLGCKGLMRSLSISELRQIRDTGWRVPTKDELLTLIDPVRQHAGRAPYIDTKAFPDMLTTSPAQYMTSTPYSNIVWCVDFHLGTPTNCGTYPGPVRLIKATP